MDGQVPVLEPDATHLGFNAVQPDPGSGTAVQDSVALRALHVQARYTPSANALEVDSAWRAVFAGRPMSEMLAASTGINLKTYGPGALSTAGYRGGAARHTAVRWNGMRLNSPLHGSVDLNLLPIGGMERIRLDAGASAAAQSGGTPGGLLDLHTGTDAVQAVGALELNGGMGAFGLMQGAGVARYGKDQNAARSWSARSSGQWSTARWDYPLQHPDWGDLGRMPDQELERIQWQQDLEGHNAKGDRWHAAAAISHVDRFLSPALFATDQGESERDRMGVATLQWQTRPMDGARNWSAFVRSGWAADQVLYQNRQAGIVSRSEAHSVEAGGGASWHPVQNWHLEAQAFLRRESGRSGGLLDPDALAGGTDTSVLRWEQRLRASAVWRPSSALAVRLDLLQDRYGGRWQPTLPALHLRWQHRFAALVLQWEAGIARHYTRPALNDLYWHPGGNPALEAERGWNADLEVQLQGHGPNGQWTLVVQGWGQDIRNWIQWTPGHGGYWAAGNIGRVRGAGMESRLEWRWPKRGRASGGSWMGQLLYAWTRLRPEGGTVLLLQPEHRASGLLGYSSKRHPMANGTLAWSAGMRAVAVGRRFAASDGTRALPAYAPLGLDLGLVYRGPRWHARFGAHLENAANSWMDAAWNRPMPGRWWRSSLTLGWHGKADAQ